MSFYYLSDNLTGDLAKLNKLAKRIGGKLETVGEAEPEDENYLQNLDVSINIKPLEILNIEEGEVPNYIEYVAKNGKIFRIYTDPLEIVDVTEGKEIRIPKLAEIDYVDTIINSKGTITITFAPSLEVEEED